MIELKDVYYSYKERRALRGVSLSVDRGEHVALVGGNASGKSTLAMMMNALLLPDSGDCFVDGVNTRDDPSYARKVVSMVFQDPEDQVVARKVRDDTAFGPRNLGLSEDEVERRVANALRAVGLEQYADRGVSTLSGGQKQLLAIAGTLAMEPSYIVLDEPTSLLDGNGAKAVRDAVAGMKRNNKGIVWITHDMEEVMIADIVAVLKEGKMLACLPPDELFFDTRLMAEAGLEAPYTWRLLKHAKKIGTVNIQWG